MALDDWAYSYNGLTFGAGTDYYVQKVTGLNPPDSRQDVIEKAEDHGAYIYAKYLTHRIVTFEGDLSGDPGADFEAKVTALRAAVIPREDALPLVLMIPGQVEWQLDCLPVRRFFDIDTDYDIGYVKWALQFIAEDPRLYSTTEESSVSDPASTLGETFSIAFDMEFGGGSGGSLSADNGGIFETWPTAYISGPVTNPRLRHVGKDKKIQVDTTLVAGDQLVIDFANRTIKRNGSSVYGSLTSDSEWWSLDPGDNDIQYVVGSGSGTAELRWRDAWI